MKQPSEIVSDMVDLVFGCFEGNAEIKQLTVSIKIGQNC